MWALIIAAIVLLIVLLLLTPVKVNVLSAGNVSLKVGVGPIKINVLKKKKKKIKLKDFSQKKYLSKIDELKRQKNKPKVKEKSKNGEKTPLSDTVDFILGILRRVDTYTGRLITRVKRLEVSVGGSDPAAAAVTYGVASQGVAYLLEVLDNKTTLKKRKSDIVSVNVDYLSSDIKVNADVELSVKVIDAVKTVIEILMLKAKHETNTTNTRKAGQENV